MSLEKLYLEIIEKRGAMNFEIMKKHLTKLRGSAMVGQAVDHKRIGIKRLGEIAESYTMKQQHSLNTYLDLNPTAKKREIELFLSVL